MTENFVEQFAAPGAEYRGIPFWSWNGKLEQEKLRRQIRSFRELGFGGFLYCFSVKKPPAEPVCSRIALALRAKKKLHAIVLRGSPTALP